MDQEHDNLREARRAPSSAEDELLNRVRMLERELIRTKRFLNILEDGSAQLNFISDVEMSAVIVMR